MASYGGEAHLGFGSVAGVGLGGWMTRHRETKTRPPIADV